MLSDVLFRWSVVNGSDCRLLITNTYQFNQLHEALPFSFVSFHWLSVDFGKPTQQHITMAMRECADLTDCLFSIQD